MSGQIFISYRREESWGVAGRLYDRLGAHFDPNQVFMDIDTIPLGEDFVQVIEETVAKCDVLIAMIGKNWLTTKDKRRKRRLDDPEDFVRMEIGAALKRKIRVIPVLVDGALMPRSTDLPADLKSLARRNALRITDTSFGGDCQRLVAAIKLALEKAAAEQQERLATEQRQREEAEQRQLPTSGSGPAAAGSGRFIGIGNPAFNRSEQAQAKDPYNHVFLSYRYENDEHAQAVRNLGDKLRATGLPVELDQFYCEDHPGGPDEGWPKWNEDRMAKSACVLVVCSKGWFDAYNGESPRQEGFGAAFEAIVLRQVLFYERKGNTRVRLVDLDNFSEASIPPRLRDWYVFRLFNDDAEFDQMTEWIRQRLAMPGSSENPPSDAVFISYAEEDLDAAQKLKDGLGLVGIDVWFDKKKFQGDDTWWLEIEERLDRCSFFIPLISQNSVGKPDPIMFMEWNRALRRATEFRPGAVFIIPVVIDGVAIKTAAVPRKFRDLSATHLPGGEATPEFKEYLQKLKAQKLKASRP